MLASIAPPLILGWETTFELSYSNNKMKTRRIPIPAGQATICTSFMINNMGEFVIWILPVRSISVRSRYPLPSTNNSSHFQAFLKQNMHTITNKGEVACPPPLVWPKCRSLGSYTIPIQISFHGVLEPKRLTVSTGESLIHSINSKRLISMGTQFYLVRSLNHHHTQFSLIYHR